MSKLEKFKIYQMLERTAEKLGGKLSYKYQQVTLSVGGGAFNFVIAKKMFGLDVHITTSLSEYPLRKDEYEYCGILITAFKPFPKEVFLSIWTKDYFDKLFGFGSIKTGYKDFDKKIGLKSSKNIERAVPKAFENPELREQLMNDNLRTYNAGYENGQIIIRAKTELRMKSEDMVAEEYRRFELFLAGLKNAYII
jgi:hypothetical protein